MTKNELVKWLEKEKTEAVKKAEENYQEALQDLRESYYKELGVDELVHRVQPLFHKIHEEYEKFSEKIDSVGDVSACKYAYRWKYYDIENLKDEAYLKEAIKEAIRFKSSHEYGEKERILMLERTKVANTYNTVIQTVKNLPTYKDGIEYLKKLGFDTSKIVPESKKLLPATVNVNVDIRYLLLNKNKGEENEIS